MRDELAKALYMADWHTQRPEYALEQVSGWWDREGQLCRDQYGVVAQAAVEFFFGKGHKGVPARDAGKLMLEALREVRSLLSNPALQRESGLTFAGTRARIEAALLAAGEEV